MDLLSYLPNIFGSLSPGLPPQGQPDADSIATIRQKAAVALAQAMRQQTPTAPASGDGASFADRFAGDPANTVWPSSGNGVPLPLSRPNIAAAPTDNSLDNLYLSAAKNQPQQAAPVAAPTSSSAPPSFGDRAIAALADFGAGGRAGGLFGALTGAVQGAATGQRFDPTGIQNQTVQALIAKGVQPEMARVMAGNPDIMKQVIPQFFGAKQLQHVTIKDSLNNEIPMTFDPSTGRYRDTSGNVIGVGGANVAGSGIGPLGSGSAASLPIEIDPSTGRDEKFLAALSPIDRAAVNGVLNGDVNAQGRNMQRYLPYATRAEPGFSQQTYLTRLKTQNDFAPQGVSGKNITAINTALGHIDQMYNAADKLGNFQYLPILNTPYNAMRGQLSPDYQNTVAGFKASAIGSSGELAKAFRAAGMSEQDIQAWQKQFDANSSPATIKGSAEQALHMLDSRLDSIADSYNRGMNVGAQKSGPDLLSPTARAIHERLLGGGVTAPVQAQPQAVQTATASAAIVAAVATGQLTPSEAAELSKIVESYTRVLQAADFEIRLSKVEKEVGHDLQHHR